MSTNNLQRISIGKNLSFRRDIACRVLEELVRKGGLSSKDLARRVGVDPARIRSTLSWLNGMGLITADFQPTEEGALIHQLDSTFSSPISLAVMYANLASNSQISLWYHLVNDYLYATSLEDQKLDAEKAFQTIVDLMSDQKKTTQLRKDVRMFFTMLQKAHAFGPLKMIHSKYKELVPGFYVPPVYLAGYLLMKSHPYKDGAAPFSVLRTRGGLVRIFLLPKPVEENLLHDLDRFRIVILERSSGLDRFICRDVTRPLQLLEHAYGENAGT